MSLVKIENEKNLLRDENSKAILSTDMTSLQKYRFSRNLKQKTLEEQKNIVEEQNNIKKELSEIKELLSTLIGKIK